MGKWFEYKSRLQKIACGYFSNPNEAQKINFGETGQIFGKEN